MALVRAVNVTFIASGVSQASPAEAVPGAAEEAGSSVLGLREEHHAQPAEAGPAPHQGRNAAGRRLVARGLGGRLSWALLRCRSCRSRTSWPSR